ncbi:thiol:disulfide interchange protein, partial [Flavobacterium sp. HMWF030]
MINFKQYFQTIMPPNICGRYILFVLLFFFAFAKSNAQILEPVKWTSKIEKKAANNAVLIFDGTIEKEWHLYSQFTPEGGPLALEIVFKNQKGNYQLVGKAKEGKTKTAFNDIFGVNETFFEEKAHIEQEIKIINPNLKTIEVDFDFQVCKKVCINSNEKFSIAVPSDFKMSALPAFSESKSDDTKVTGIAVDTGNTAATAKKQIVQTDADTAVSREDIPATAPARSLWSIFFVAFISGFAALLTPCVFPMI